MSTDPSQHDGEPGSGRGESDEELEHKARDAADETETVDPRARPAAPRVAIEGYEIIRELHRGGQGVVYEAVQKSTKRKVAIKVLLEGQFASASARRRFQREVALAAGLKHPNIIAIFDSGQTPDGHQFCVMDYVRGRSVRSHVRESKLSLEATLELFSSVCEAAHFAHLKGVIHRDLKPSNILVDTDGLPRVLDFGLAKQLAGGAESLVSMTGQVVGTLQYMSPEQTRGNPDEIDARSDVYSLGVILYELLTGRHPYPVKGEMLDVVKHITETEPTPPSKVWTAESGVSRRKSGRFRTGQCPIDGELQTIAIKALAKERERRYQSADALRQDIASYLAGDPIEAKRDSSLYVLRKSLRRHRIPIAVMFGFVAVAAGALYVGLRAGGRDVSAPLTTGPITSVAVLPLENLSGDPGQEYFADGMTGELITALGRISALQKVISLTSVMQYKEQSKPIPQIVRELNVDGVIEGAVQQSGDRVLISARLIHGPTDRQLWGNRYDRDMRDVLAMQGDIARSIAREIKIAVTPAEELRLTTARRVNPEAYRLYLQGQSHHYTWTEEGFKKAIESFEQAVGLDPMCAPAWAGLAEVYLWQGFLGAERREAHSEAMTAARKALEFDDTLGLAHATLGQVKFFVDWDWHDPEKDFQRALELSPNNAHVHYLYSVYLILARRSEEGIAESKLALELDPFQHYYHENLGWCYWMAQRHNEAISEYHKLVEKKPNERFYYIALANNYAAMGMDGEALAECAKMGGCQGATAWVYAVAGKREDALNEIARLKGIEPVIPWPIAVIYAGLGEKEQAFQWLEKVYEDRSPMAPWLNISHKLDSLRDDPRFDDLLRRIGLEPSRAAGFPGAPGRGPTTGESPLGTDKIMLAVLPFKNLGSPDEEYFADGISDEIRSRLATVRRLGVISRASAFQYKQTPKTNQQVGSELGVDYLIDGTIRWDKGAGGTGRVRITPELIRVSDDSQLWSQPYNRVIEDIFEVQSDIAGQVVKQLKITLLESERQAVEVIPTESLGAYNAYLRGLDYAGRLDSLEENHRLAIQMFERAVSLDPNFALAYAQLSKAHSIIHHGGQDPTEVRSSKAKAAVGQAFELQPELPEAYLALGWYYYGCQRDYERALEALTTAEKGLPNDARILAVVGYIRRRQGRFEATLGYLKRAFELSPLSADLATDIAHTYIFLRRYPQAERWYDHSISLAPDQTDGYLWKASIYWLWHGDTERARATLEELPTRLDRKPLWPWIRQELHERDYEGALDRLASTSIDCQVNQTWFIPISQLTGLIYHLIDDPEQARSSYDAARVLLENALKGQPDDHRIHSSLGIVYAGLGRTEEAIREGKLGVDLLPVSKDAMLGPSRVEDLAFIYVLLGEYDAALDRIEHLLSVPSRFSVPLLRLDPRWDPLRNHPRYDALLRRHGYDPEPDSQSAADTSSDKIMLAVLPFENLGPSDEEYFADGISDEIRSRLAAVRKLGVISRASAFQYKHIRDQRGQVASELNVDYLIDGTIRWSRHQEGAERVRITPELIRVSDEMVLWSQPYNRVIEDIFEIQSDIAEQVVSQLNVTLLGSERRAIEAKPTENLPAYHAYLRGMDYASRPDYAEADYEMGIEMFERAINLDPRFASAYAELAIAHADMYHHGHDRTQARVAKARAAVDRALALDPDLPEAHLAAGRFHYHCRREYDDALQELKIAEQSHPSASRMLLTVGAIRRRQGQFDQALDYFVRAFELSPKDPQLAWELGHVYMFQRMYAEAERYFEHSISMAPDQVMVYEMLASLLLAWHGETEGAQAILEQMPNADDPLWARSRYRLALLERDYSAALDIAASSAGGVLERQDWLIVPHQMAGTAYHLMGDPERARGSYESARVLLELIARERPNDHRVCSSLGIVYAGLGRKEEAVRQGKRGVELMPVSKDAVTGPYRVEDLAFVYVLVGEYENALDQIEYLLSIPSEEFSIHLLRLDPRWAPLRDHPRYKELLRRHGYGLEPDSQSAAHASSDKVMLAVLPFEDMSPEPQEWFSDGMTEEMIAQLGRLHPKKLGVIARTSAMRYKNTDKRIAQIGRELGVGYLLEGSVRRAGNRVRITATLVQVDDETPLWAEHYDDRAAADLFDIQADVAELIAQSLALRLLPTERGHRPSTRPGNAAAHEAYLKGRYFWNKRTEEGLKRSVTYFQEAIDQDPGYATAYAGLADAYAILGINGHLPPAKTIPLARAAAMKAMQIDERLAQPHASLGLILYAYDWDWTGAERELRQALQLNPNYASAHHWYSNLLDGLDRGEEALREIKRAAQLDPLSLIINTNLGNFSLVAKRYEDAIDQYQKVIQLDPRFPWVYWALAETYWQMGDYQKWAGASQKRFTLREGKLGSVENLEQVYEISGENGVVRAVIEHLTRASSRTYVSPAELAMWYAKLGEKDRAFNLLEKAHEGRDAILTSFIHMPEFDTLRSDPRFDDLLRRIGLEAPSISAGQTP